MKLLTLSTIKQLPEVLENIIKSFIPIQVQYQLTKKNYIQYRKFIKQHIYKINQCENYIRDTIRKNHDFVFYFILKENYNQWIQRKKYHYKDLCYKNYLCFLENYCIQNQSTKCRTILQNMNKQKLRQPQKQRYV